MSLHEIIYLSRASEPMSTEALAALMEKSRIDNVARGITGVLIYHQQEFLQLIEGERAASPTGPWDSSRLRRPTCGADPGTSHCSASA
jgi:hypothetical protein